MRTTLRRLCSAIIAGTFVCMPVAGVARSDAQSLGLFEDALEADGFHVTPGAVELWNPTADWCAAKPGVEHAWYTNNAP